MAVVTDRLDRFEAVGWGGAGAAGLFVRDGDGRVVGSVPVGGPTVAELADAPLSNSGDESREGSTPSRGTCRHVPETYGDAFYERGQRMRRARCRACSTELEARRG